MASKYGTTICLISPFPPPYGGMAVQAQKLCIVLKEAGFAVVPIKTNSDFPRNLKWVGKIPFIRTVVNMILFLINLHHALKKCDIVYFLTGFFNFFFWVTAPAILLTKISRKKIILNARGGEAGVFFNKWKYVVKPLIKMTDLVVTPSGFLKEIFERQLKIKAVIVPNIADIHQFMFIERQIFRPRLIVTRGLEEMYNVACVIRAFKIVHDEMPESTLAVVGDGSQRTMLENLTDSLGLKNAVRFHGFVEHRMIQKLYTENDIFVNASNVDNFPGTVLEAFASGLPVVSTNAGGIPYMVTHEKTGLLVGKNDHQAMAEQILRLMKDQNLASFLANNARKECQNYSDKTIKNKLMQIMKRL